jgi:hypothetical protein
MTDVNNLPELGGGAGSIDLRGVHRRSPGGA